MNPDFTQPQSLSGLRQSQSLSLQSSAPPAEVPGYKVERLLGRGAFGQVWLGMDVNTGRQVAIKFYLHSSSVNWTQLKQEVKHLVSMSTGRYIVQVLAVGWESQPPYYVMEYLENGSLEDAIRKHNVLNIPQSIAIFREIAEGLSYAHGKGVLHCDLKPANVLLDHSLRPRLADFGQSRMSNDQTPSLGTLFFMAPEQADLQAMPDAAWDVYALGAIAYAMLVGSPPYRSADSVKELDTAGSLPERLQRYQATLRLSPRPRLHYRRRGVDKQFCQIIDRCLAPAPTQRYSNVQQVIAAIDQRQYARTRRPLVLMALLGPILLLLALLWFSSVSIAIAKRESLEQVQQLSLQGNLQTAKYAKATMEGELRSLYQLVEREAMRPDLIQALQATVENNQAALAAIAEQKESSELTTQLKLHADRVGLNRLLDERIQTIIAREGPFAGRGKGDGVAIFNSLLIVEARGTNLGIAFVDPAEKQAESPVGKNFAYRSYFHGGREDGSKSDSPSKFRPTRVPQLSASFRSTTTGQWKLGVSSPIWPQSAHRFLEQGQHPPPEVQPLGVLVLTVNLGDFVLLGGVSSGDSQFTTLVDGRGGNQRGTLLQHPLIEAMDRDTMVKSKMPQIKPPQLDQLMKSDGIVDYDDPAAQFPGGEPFDGSWIAAMAQVELPRTDRGAQHAASPVDVSASDLWVLVQERSRSVYAPVSELGNRLQSESAKALAALSLLIMGLWFALFRYRFWFRLPTLGLTSWRRSKAVAPETPSPAQQSTAQSDL